MNEACISFPCNEYFDVSVRDFIHTILSMCKSVYFNGIHLEHFTL